jgi:hypothetical protein
MNGLSDSSINCANLIDIGAIKAAVALFERKLVEIIVNKNRNANAICGEKSPTAD